MAAAYYDAISKYLARRGDHIGYAFVEGPAEPVAPGSAVTYRVEVRNQGTEPIRGWRLKVNAVKAPKRYVSRVRNSTEVGLVELPNIKAGERRVVTVPGTAPGPGDWTLLFDARDGDGERAAELGSPMLQVPLSVFDPTPTPEPTPEVSPDPSADA